MKVTSMVNPRTYDKDCERKKALNRQIMPGFPKKEPFKSRDEVKEYLSGKKIQCLICGKSYFSVGRHLTVHNVSLEDYKTRYGIPMSWGMLTPETKKNKAKNIKPEQKAFAAKLQAKEIKERKFNTEWVKNEKKLELDEARKAVRIHHFGESHYAAILSEADVLAILESKDHTADLARKYGVDFSTIAGVRKGRKWKHLQPSNKSLTREDNVSGGRDPAPDGYPPEGVFGRE